MPTPILLVVAISVACVFLAAASIVVATLSLRSATEAIRKALRLSGGHAPILAPIPGRVILPMSSGDDLIAPGETRKIVGRPRNLPFRPERIVIGGTPADWIVNDIRIDGRSQFSQSGDLPGEMFDARAMDAFVRFETVGVDQELEITATYIGGHDPGVPFACGVLGEASVA